MTRENCFSVTDVEFQLFGLSTRKVRGDLITAFKCFPRQKILGSHHFSQLAEKDNNRIQWLEAGHRRIKLEIQSSFITVQATGHYNTSPRRDGSVEQDRMLCKKVCFSQTWDVSYSPEKIKQVNHFQGQRLNDHFV